MPLCGPPLGSSFSDGAYFDNPFPRIADSDNPGSRPLLGRYITTPFASLLPAQVGGPSSLGHPTRAASAAQMDNRGRQLRGWANKLIWGGNKLILSSLKNGPLREEIKKQGGLKLIYIDPPFDLGADFSMGIEIGGDTFTNRGSGKY